MGPAIILLTRASIRGVRVDRAGLVEFATGWQHRTAGFHLHQTNDPAGRRGLERLTVERIPAPRPDSQLPILYSARTAPITAPYVVIEEIERGGGRRLMGPFAVGDARQQALLERIERRLARAGAEAAFVSSAARARVVPLAAREAATRSRALPLRPRTIEPRRPLDPASVKIETVGEGVATVTRESLEAAGLPVAPRLADCRLTRQGLPAPFEVRDEGGVAEALAFRAEALETAYSSRNVYVLTWGGPAPGDDGAADQRGRPDAAGLGPRGAPAALRAERAAGDGPLAVGPARARVRDLALRVGPDGGDVRPRGLARRRHAGGAGAAALPGDDRAPARRRPSR